MAPLPAPFELRDVDATADYSDEMMHAALDINLPNYAAIVTTKEVIASISSLYP